jgi:hypothetical protein
VSDEDGDVLEVSVNDIGICDDAVLITEVDVENKTAEISLTLAVDFDAYVEFFDQEGSPYEQ